MATAKERIQAAMAAKQASTPEASGGAKARIQAAMAARENSGNQNSPTTPERDAEPWYEDFAEGVVSSGMGTYYGIKDLTVGMDDEDKARLKDWKEDAAQSGWGTAGNVVGEVAQLALPGGAALKGAKALNAAGKLAKTAKALPLATDVLASSALGYVKPPEEGKTRGERARWVVIRWLRRLAKVLKGLQKPPKRRS
jgi:hypothetical protein